MKTAKTLVGTKEAPGSANNPTIMGWAKKLGIKVLGIVYNADTVPWCGMFAAHCLTEAGITPPKIAVRASSYETWGIPLKVAAPGCILTFRRPGGGHVGFAVAESKTAFLVLGGNQGDRVSEAWIEKSRCTSMRWPTGYPAPKMCLPWRQSGALSKNEA